ncbi:MAG: hypothetical protein JWL78_851, partial [Chloroflexi bacterium]|nr:hypothetical protein [Chloroflexota bacterium]
ARVAATAAAGAQALVGMRCMVSISPGAAGAQPRHGPDNGGAHPAVSTRPPAGGWARPVVGRLDD